MPHRRAPFRRLALAAFLPALVAAAPARADRAEGSFSGTAFGAIRLAEPAPQVALRGGETAVLQWETSVSLGADVEEWEAFLSFDGGRTFPQRITPHVAIGQRSVLWQVPNAPTSDARILLRLGNEREERAVLLPQVFHIEQGARATWTLRRFAAGEPARTGEPGVVAWAEGDRTGRGSREVEAAPLDGNQAGASAPQMRSDSRDQVCERAAGPASLPPPPSTPFEPATPPSDGTSVLAARPSTGDILLLIQRRNE